MTWADTLHEAQAWADEAMSSDSPYVARLRTHFPTEKAVRRALILTAMYGPDRAADLMGAR